MKIETVANMIKITAEEGKVLRRKGEEEIFDTTEVWLSSMDSVDNWEEIDSPFEDTGKQIEESDSDNEKPIETPEEEFERQIQEAMNSNDTELKELINDILGDL